MEKAAIGTNDLGMHIVIRPISKDLLSKRRNRWNGNRKDQLPLDGAEADNSR